VVDGVAAIPQVYHTQHVMDILEAYALSVSISQG